MADSRGILDLDTSALLVSADAAARLLGVSRSHFYSLLSAGQVPSPVHLGRAARWRAEELRQWVQAGCPNREKWEAEKSAEAS